MRGYADPASERLAWLWGVVVVAEAAVPSCSRGGRNTGVFKRVASPACRVALVLVRRSPGRGSSEPTCRRRAVRKSA